MIFALIVQGREIARGSFEEVLEAGEERGLVERLTHGAHTADPAAGWRYRERGVLLAPIAMAVALRARVGAIFSDPGPGGPGDDRPRFPRFSRGCLPRGRDRSGRLATQSAEMKRSRCPQPEVRK